MAVNFGRLGTVTFGRNTSIVCTPESQIVAPADVTPNAVNWPNPADGGAGTTTTIGQQITGINTTITLQIDWTGTNAVAALQGLYIAVNTSNTYGGTIYTVQNSIGASTTGTYSFTVNPNEWVFFRVTTSDSITRNLTIKNTSDGGVTLDTVTLTSSNI